RQPGRVRRRGRLPGRPAHAGGTAQGVAGLLGVQVPLGPGAGRRDRRGHRPGRPAAADRREERPVPTRVRQLLRRAPVRRGGRRPVLPPGSLVPMHPVAFLVITSREVYGVPVSTELAVTYRRGKPSPESFGLTPQQLEVVVIAPGATGDVVGLVTALEGEPL